MAVLFAAGTPADVRRDMGNWLSNRDLHAEVRSVIERLAGNEAMEPFWKQLPDRLHSRAADIIYWAILAYIESTSLQTPLVQRFRGCDEFLQTHSPPITDPALLKEYKALVYKAIPTTYAMITERARSLLEDLDQFGAVGRRHWAEVWPCDPKLDFDKVRTIIGDIAACCDRLDADALQFRHDQSLPPPPRKLGSHTAQHVYFDRILKARSR